jgi:hypothetical protein
MDKIYIKELRMIESELKQSFENKWIGYTPKQYALCDGDYNRAIVLDVFESAYRIGVPLLSIEGVGAIIPHLCLALVRSNVMALFRHNLLISSLAENEIGVRGPKKKIYGAVEIDYEAATFYEELAKWKIQLSKGSKGKNFQSVVSFPLIRKKEAKKESNPLFRISMSSDFINNGFRELPIGLVDGVQNTPLPQGERYGWNLNRQQNVINSAEEKVANVEEAPFVEAEVWEPKIGKPSKKRKSPAHYDTAPCLLSKSKYADASVCRDALIQLFPALEGELHKYAPLFSLEDYHQKALDWSVGKGNKKIDWLTTIQTWAQADIDKLKCGVPVGSFVKTKNTNHKPQMSNADAAKIYAEQRARDIRS